MHSVSAPSAGERRRDLRHKPLRTLIVEDSEDDAELLVHELERGGYHVHFLRVETEPAMRDALTAEAWDIVISDYAMPSFDAPRAIRTLKQTGLDIPIIVVSGTIGEDAAVEALKAGAGDFLVKGRFARLLPAIERELREAELRRQSRLAELALHDSEVKYRRIVETAQEGIWLIDASGCTTYVNQRMAQLLAEPPERLIGSSFYDFLDDEWKEVARRSLGQRADAVLEHREFKFQRRDGTEFWASLSTSAIADDSGLHAGALAMVADVTEQRKLQAQLMVSDRLVSVGTLAAGVAHEINNPLTSVVANLDLALPSLDSISREFGESPALRELREQLADARESARRVQHIVRDLKVFSRAQEDKRGAVDVQRVLDSALRLAWNEIRHRAKLVKNYGQVPPVDANESRLGQVFLNLIINAAHAIPEGQADSNEIRISSLKLPDGRVAIDVTDTGLGMSAEVQKKLFTPFFTTKPIGVGTGLGLSICHRIVAAVGGEIAVESQVGKGTTFRVMLLAAAEGMRESQTPTPKPLAAAQRGRILVVDDEPMMTKVIARTLGPEHDVVTTVMAEEAIGWIAGGQRFDVILCDLMMPRITGMDFHAEVSRADPDQARRVIFLTGGAFTPRMRAFLDEVENLCLEKPFEPNALRAVINRRVAEG